MKQLLNVRIEKYQSWEMSELVIVRRAKCPYKKRNFSICYTKMDSDTLSMVEKVVKSNKK